MSGTGTFYGVLIDPVLKKMRERIIQYIEPGQSVLDVACGTGAQIFEVAGRAGKAVGFDISESMINRARLANQKRNFDNVEFKVQDATEEWPYNDFEFDVAVLSLALHQFSPKNYFVVLNEMKRVAAKQIFVDYVVPLPSNYAGVGSRIAEFLAGREHYQNFRHYSRVGGLPEILSRHRYTIKNEELFAKRVFQLIVCV